MVGSCAIPSGRESTDILVIGGGIVGVTLALELRRRFRDLDVMLIEKETEFARHASGRNSGVLHAGFYYDADSLKARFTRDGNRLMREYCEEHRLPVNPCGKLVVARDSSEVETLALLMERARLNGVELERISAEEARKIEPRVKTAGAALWSPTTASVDPGRVMRSLLEDARSEGVIVRSGVAFRESEGDGVVATSAGKMHTGYVINAAGLYADKIARAYGFSADYGILPFKGLYLKSDEAAGSIATNIYPVPDLRNPFLGVHFTVTVDGGVKIGPTAIPAFWREHYRGVDNFRLNELVEIVARELGLLVHNRFGFKRLAVTELMRYSRANVLSDADRLLSGIDHSHYKTWGPAGIRAQLVNLKTRKLEMDFHYEGDERSFHVLNAVSPAFTCSLSFSSFLAEKVTELMG